MAKPNRKFVDLLKENGLSLVSGRKHYLIQRNGNTVGFLPHSSYSEQRYRDAVLRLNNRGLLPDAARRIKFS